jgi:hypothetical protein
VGKSLGKLHKHKQEMQPTELDYIWRTMIWLFARYEWKLDKSPFVMSNKKGALIGIGYMRDNAISPIIL